MAAQTRPPHDQDTLRRFRRYWRDELIAADLYRGLAGLAGDDKRRRTFEQLAATEERHAAHWQELLEGGGHRLRRPRRTLRSLLLLAIARVWGIDTVLPIVIRAEAADAERYRGVPEAPESMVQQELGHGETFAAMASADVGARIGFAERRHRTGAGGALRAATFGVNDGLVSNLALVMGVAGGAGSGEIVLLAGVAGLVAGAFSMAAGEWISVRSQRELYEREIEVEREELEAFPDQEREELSLILQARGLSSADATAAAARLIEDPEAALDVMAREELGLDPSNLGNPWVAAGSSFASFTGGALVPVLPFVFGTGSGALVVAMVLSALGLFAVGAAISLFTGRSAAFSGARMLLVGALAAALTYGVGSLVGVSVG